MCKAEWLDFESVKLKVPLRSHDLTLSLTHQGASDTIEDIRKPLGKQLLKPQANVTVLQFEANVH